MKTTLERDRQRIQKTKDLSAKTIKTCSKNDLWRQGDIEIRFIKDKPTFQLEAIKRPEYLAPGNTKGSRHGLVGEEIQAYHLTDKTVLDGPVLYCPNGLTVPHPEHGDITIEESGWYAITYQRAFSEELKRQRD